MKKNFFAVLLLIAALMTISVRGWGIEGEDGPKTSSEGFMEDPKALFEDLQIVADSMTLIGVDYVEQVKVKDLIYGAVKGMMGTLDDYSQFLDPEGFREITEETRGEFGGIGIEIGVRQGVLTVISPIEDTPAFRAGIKSGDRVVKIDDSSTMDMTLDDAVKMLRGEPGSSIKLVMIREGEDKLLEFDITRAIIKVKSIKETRLIDGDIGYIKISEFQERTGYDVKSAIKNLKEEGAKSLIIDVRNNPGGLLDSSVETADLFLPQGAMIVYTEGRDPSKRMEFKARKKTEFDDMALVVLVNKGSASAAEIFAGAVKDNKRGLIIGEQTFGKGSVQTVIPLKDGSALRITTAAYYTPSGKNLRDKGVDPDIAVEERENIADFEASWDEEQDTKERIFEKAGEKKDRSGKEKGVRKTGESDPGNGAGDPDKDEHYDGQLEAAINVLNGLRIFEGYKSSHPVMAAGETVTADHVAGEE